jgi:hypothetical protein
MSRSYLTHFYIFLTVGNSNDISKGLKCFFHWLFTSYWLVTYFLLTCDIFLLTCDIFFTDLWLDFFTDLWHIFYWLVTYFLLTCDIFSTDLWHIFYWLVTWLFYWLVTYFYWLVTNILLTCDMTFYWLMTYFLLTCDIFFTDLWLDFFTDLWHIFLLTCDRFLLTCDIFFIDLWQTFYWLVTDFFTDLWHIFFWLVTKHYLILLSCVTDFYCDWFLLTSHWLVTDLSMINTDVTLPSVTWIIFIVTRETFPLFDVTRGIFLWHVWHDVTTTSYFLFLCLMWPYRGIFVWHDLCVTHVT